MKIYNSYTNQTEEFVPVDGKKVKMYVCGPTVYDYAHLGHARCYITWDMVVRYLRFRGYDVTYARNITDVDDKIIARAQKEGTTPSVVSKKYAEEFEKSMKALNVLPPDVEPLATQNIQEMIAIVKKLQDDGFAYEVDGDVYFRVKKFPKYGMLSNQSIKDLEAGARVEASDKKEDALDFALWKSAKEGEISWSSPWGQGRPGWHIECPAMARKYLAPTIDIHAGGQDLLFPHHENEIAQSECAFKVPFAKYWMHNGFVTINKEKMSKSLGNFVTINKLLESYDSDTIRFFILTNHYRMPVEFNDEALTSAKAGLKRLKNAVVDLKEYAGDDLAVDLESEEAKAFVEAMDDDFNTSKALAVLFDLASKAQKAKNSDDKKELVRTFALLVHLSDVLGFSLDKSKSGDNKLVDSLMALILDIRKNARQEKNWALSDKIRDELAASGVILKDTKDGTSWIIE